MRTITTVVFSRLSQAQHITQVRQAAERGLDRIPRQAAALSLKYVSYDGDRGRATVDPEGRFANPYLDRVLGKVAAA